MALAEWLLKVERTEGMVRAVVEALLLEALGTAETRVLMAARPAMREKCMVAVYVCFVVMCGVIVFLSECVLYEDDCTERVDDDDLTWLDLSEENIKRFEDDERKR